MPCRSTPRPRFHAATLLLSVAVTACSTQPAPAPPPVVASVAPPEKPASAVRLVTAAPKTVDLRWAFTTGADLCTALASGPGGSFQIQTTTARQVLVTARFSSAIASAGGAKPAKLSFSGPAGDWSMAGTWHRREFATSRSLDELGMASVLGLLGGGTASVTAGTAHVGTAHLPPSSAEGNAWVQCPKQMMAGW